MKAKSILGLVLGAFVVVAVIFTVREPRATQQAAAPVRAAAIPAAPPAAATQTFAAAPASTETAAPQVPAAPQAAAGSQQPKQEKAPAPSPVVSTAGSVPGAMVTVPPSPQHKVVAMYFHGDIRCATCRKVEAYAKEAVEQGFGEQVKSGLVEFRAVNVDQPENRHFIEDYQLVNRSVVVVDEVNGSVARWVKLDNVWGLVGNHDAYLLYVQDAVRAYVEN